MKKILVLAGCISSLLVSNNLQAVDNNKTISNSQIIGRDDCSKCEKAAEEAYKTAQQTEDSENFENLRKYAGQAMKAFEDAKEYADDCGCESAEDEAAKGYKLAKKA